MKRLIRQFKEEQLFTKSWKWFNSSDDFFITIRIYKSAASYEKLSGKLLTLDNSFIPFAEKYFRKFRFILVSNDVSEWSAYITEFYNLNKFFMRKL